MKFFRQMSVTSIHIFSTSFVRCEKYFRNGFNTSNKCTCVGVNDSHVQLQLGGKKEEITDIFTVLNCKTTRLKKLVKKK